MADSLHDEIEKQINEAFVSFGIISEIALSYASSKENKEGNDIIKFYLNSIERILFNGAMAIRYLNDEELKDEK